MQISRPQSQRFCIMWPLMGSWICCFNELQRWVWSRWSMASFWKTLGGWEWSGQFSRSVVSDSLWPPCTVVHQTSLYITAPGACSIKLMSKLTPSWLEWCHPTISSSVVPFSSHLQSFPASGSFLMSQLFTSGGQNIVVSISASVLLMNIQDWFPLGWNGWISLQSKGLSRVFSNTTVEKHQFFGAQLSLFSNGYIHTWLLEKL